MTDLVQVIVARIGRAHGINGDLSIEVRTDEPERRLTAGATLLTDQGTELTIERTKWHSGRLLAHFVGINDRTGAEGLRGLELSLMVPADELPEGEDEYYDRQLIGLRVLTEDGNQVGVVVDVVHLPGQDLLAIDVDGEDRLVPFVSELVPRVDLDAGELVVADRPGLLDDQAEIAESGPSPAEDDER